MQFIKFGIVGLSNTLIGYIIYVLSLYFLQWFKLFPSYDVYISQFVMFLLSVAWSFYWNNRFVFSNSTNKRNSLLIKLIKTYISYAFTSLFLSEVLLVLWVEILEINGYVAPIINLLITVPLNFILQKIWVFKDKGKGDHV